MSLVPKSLLFKLGLHWNLLGALLSHPCLLGQWVSSLRVHLDSLLKHSLLGSIPRVCDSVGLGGGPSFGISNTFRDTHFENHWTKEKNQSCSSENMPVISQLKTKCSELCAFFTLGEGLIARSPFTWDHCHKIFSWEK